MNAELIVKGDFENPRLYFDDNKLTEDKSSGNESLLTFGSVMSKYINDKRGGWSEKRYEA